MSKVPSPPLFLTDQTPFPPDCAKIYAWKKRIASGGFGVVYMAEHRQLGSRVAIKLLLHDVLKEPEQVERFINEARVTAALSHPNIVKLLDHGAEYGIPWIAYEFLDGPTMTDLLEKEPLSLRVALEAVAQIADALSAAHAAGVLHRDIKPDNVILVAQGTFKVTDFGIAKWTHEGAVKTRTGMILGTPAYLAPELVTCAPPTPASDIYALGVMLYELVTGELPYRDDNPFALMEKHIKLEIPSARAKRPDLPAGLDQVLRTAMAKKPADRYASAQAMGEALAPFLTPAEAQASAIRRRPTALRSVPTRISAAPRRSRAVPLALGGLVAVVAVVALVLALRSRPEPVAVPSLSAAPVFPQGPAPSALPVPPASRAELAAQECRKHLAAAAEKAEQLVRRATITVEEGEFLNLVPELGLDFVIVNPQVVETEMVAMLGAVTEAVKRAASDRLEGPIWLEIEEEIAHAQRLVRLVRRRNWSRPLRERLKDIGRAGGQSVDPHAACFRKLCDWEMAWTTTRKTEDMISLAHALDEAVALVDGGGYDTDARGRWVRLIIHIRRTQRVRSVIRKSAEEAAREGWHKLYPLWEGIMKVAPAVVAEPSLPVSDRRFQDTVPWLLRAMSEVYRECGPASRKPAARAQAAAVEALVPALAARMRPAEMSPYMRAELDEAIDRLVQVEPRFGKDLNPKRIRR